MTELINYNDFAKLDLRVATVLEVAPHPNADKLYVLKIKLGEEERQIVAGIKPHYKEGEIVGKQIAIIANLEPMELRGVKSYGMLLAADDGKNPIALLVTDRKVEDNAKIK